MKHFKKLTAANTATLDGPLFSQAKLRRSNRRNSRLALWYEIQDLVYVLLALVLDAAFLADSLYHSSLIEALVGLASFGFCTWLAVRRIFWNRSED